MTCPYCGAKQQPDRHPAPRFCNDCGAIIIVEKKGVIGVRKA